MDLMEPWDPLDHPPRIEIRRQDSDDSDAEGGLGNVSRVVLRPPGHSGKAKRGHLSFDASFESGNLGRVDFVSEFEYDLFIRPDTCNPRYRIWFNFVVDNVRADQRVIFNLVNLSKTKNLFSKGMTPLVKTSSRPKWQRLGAKYVYYHKSPEHRNHYILSFAFVFDREEDVYQFAFSFPYSYSRLETHLSLVQQKNLPWITFQTLGLSIQTRKVQACTICNPAILTKKPKVVVLMARSHPGESPTSYVAQGLIDFMISSHPLAGILRDHVMIVVIPMINPDGVFIGNYRASLMGYDLNRHWNQISPWSHPVLNALKTYFQELDANKTMELDMIFDLHAHTSLLGTFIYGNSYEDVYRFERHILFPKLLAHNAEDYNSSYTMYNRDPHKIGSARRHLCDILRSAVNVYTLEVSVYGYIQQSNGVSHTIPYTENGYFRLGRNIARTLAEYYRVTGVIPVKVFAQAMPPTEDNEEDKKKRIVRRSRSRSRPKTLEKEKSAEGDGTRVVELSKLTQISAEDGYDADQSPVSEDADSGSISSRDSDGEEIMTAIRPDNTNTQQESGVEQQQEKSTIHHVQSESNVGRLAFRTFDFSVLTTVGAQCQDSMVLGYGATGGRKVGGGGLLGKQKSRRVRRPSIKWMSGTSGGSPSLTIVDFNQLIRMGLERRLDSGPEPAEPDPTMRVKQGRGMAARRLVRRERRITRTQHSQMTSRGTVTDESAWEESSSDSDHERHLSGFHHHHHHSAPAPLHNANSVIRHERMHLNPRIAKRGAQPKVQFS